MDIGAALGKPFSDLKNLVIGVVLSVIPILNIITVPGYFIRVASRTMAKDNKMPGFENFGELIVDSLKYLVISIVYMIPAMIVFAMALGSIIITAITASAMGDQEAIGQAVLAALAGSIGFILLGVILAILGAILILSGMLNYAKTKQFGKAFAVMENLGNFFTGSFLVALIVAIVLGIVAGAIVAALTFIPVLGFIIGIIVSFIINVANISILAEGYPQVK